MCEIDELDRPAYLMNAVLRMRKVLEIVILVPLVIKSTAKPDFGLGDPSRLPLHLTFCFFFGFFFSFFCFGDGALAFHGAAQKKDIRYSWIIDSSLIKLLPTNNLFLSCVDRHSNLRELQKNYRSEHK